MNQDDLVEQLRRVRIAAGLSQRDLAERCGRTQGWVNKVETGHRGIDLPIVELWASACGVPVELRIGGAVGELLAGIGDEDLATVRAGVEALLALASPIGTSRRQLSAT